MTTISVLLEKDWKKTKKSSINQENRHETDFLAAGKAHTLQSCILTYSRFS